MKHTGPYAALARLVEMKRQESFIVNPAPLSSPPISRRQALLGLYALQAWERIGKTKFGGDYAPRWFANQRGGFLRGLANEDRKGTILMIRRGRCLVCDDAIPEDSTGDHLIALAVGGRQSVMNYLPLCPPHNSSKGKRDLAEWWVKKGFPIDRLVPHPLCLYCRANWQLQPEGWLGEAAPPYLLTLMTQIATRLPSDEHRSAWRATYGGQPHDPSTDL